MIRTEADRQLLERLRGMTVALATPLGEDGALDVDALHRLIDFVLQEGAASIFPLGWMGEQPALTESMRRQVMQETVRYIDERVPVIMGVSEQSLPRILQEVEAASAAGADIVLATPPFSYPMTPASIADFFKQLAAASALPVILYNNSEAHTPLGPDEIESLSRIPGMIGVKDFSDFVQIERLLANVHRDGDFIVWAAEEYVLGPALFLGARYSILGGPGNLVPGWGVALHQAAEAGDWEQVARLHLRLVAFCDALYALSDSPYSTVKAALALMGYGGGRAVPPLPALSAEQVDQVRAVLGRFEVL